MLALVDLVAPTPIALACCACNLVMLQLGLLASVSTGASLLPRRVWGVEGEGDFIFPNVSEPAFTRTVYLDLESQGGKAVAGRIEIGVSTSRHTALGYGGGGG